MKTPISLPLKTGERVTRATHCPQFKTVGYAYATSSTAKQHGYGQTGCWYVRTGKQPDSDCVKGQIEGVYATKEEAQRHAERIQLDWSPLYLAARA